MPSPTPLLAFGWTNLPMLGWLAVAVAASIGIIVLGVFK